jgi:hypothetical protein
MRRYNPYIVVFLFSLFLFLPSVAWAASSEPSVLSRTLSLAFEFALAALVPVAAWLTHRAIRIFEAKTKIDVPDAVEQKVDHWVDSGIALAEERGHRFLKETTDKLTGPEKLEIAVAYVLDMANQRGWVEWSKSKIQDRVEAALGTRREDDMLLQGTVIRAPRRPLPFDKVNA